MKKELILAALLMLIGICASMMLFSGIYAQTLAGNKSFDISDRYSGNDNIQGWINVSLTNEPYNSPVTLTSGSYSSSVPLINVLKSSSGLSYTCSSGSCNNSYNPAGTGNDSKNFTLNAGDSKLIAMILTQSNMIDEISSLKFDISSSASENCIAPIMIDVGDDGTFDWSSKAYNSGSYCSTAKTYSSCYSPSQTYTPMTLHNQYCQFINISSAAALSVGASVNGTGNAAFEFGINDIDYGEQSCTQSASGSGEISCILNITINSPALLEVCLTQTSGNSYSLPFEQAPPTCGGDGTVDFGIFVQPLRFAAPGTFTLNASDDILNVIDDYISSPLYLRNCSGGCVVPIRIYSGQASQQITVNNAALAYRAGLLNPSENKLYELSIGPSLINSGFIKIPLGNAGIKSPSNPGTYPITIKIGDTTVVSGKSIQVAAVPVISDFYPTEVPAGAEVPFYVVTSGGNITGYRWDFGDNTSQVDNLAGTTTHKYLTLGARTVKISVRNSIGERNATFVINVVTPREYLNSTISYYESKISKLRSQVAGIPSNARAEVEKLVNLSSMDSQISSLRASYNSAVNESTFISLLSSAYSLNIPEAINATEKSSGKFVMNSELISSSEISNLTSEDLTGKEQLVKNAVFDWFLNSIDVTADFSTYSAIYKGSTQELVSYGVFRIAPKDDAKVTTVYAIIKKPSSEISVFNAGSELSSIGDSTGFSLSVAGGSGFEILSNEKMSLVDAPVYFFPAISELEIFNISVCNFNKVCDKQLGEDYKNCRSDCKPVARTVWLLVLLLVIFIAAYIGAQEWYKKKYESYLFKDRNDLFNLINFIDNAEKQALKKDEIFASLREKGWDNEQLTYAYNKFKGKRTGMWEIPVFSFFEKKKVNEQLELRKKIGMNPNIAPRPIRPFTPGAGKPLGFMSRNNKPIQPSNNAKPAGNQATPAAQNSQQKPAQQPASSAPNAQKQLSGPNTQQNNSQNKK